MIPDRDATMRAALAWIAALVLLAAPAFAGEGFKFRTDPGIKQVAPEKPVKIKLRRLADGKYTWEITGGTVAEVLKADGELRKRLGVK